jgi:bacterioferritin-associated ferredoxin
MGDFIVDKGIEDICTIAHMYPEQVVCFCHRIQAKDIAKAILAGANTPEEVSRMTGARAGCGTLCITGVLRLLLAAGRELKKAPGNQWYGEFVTIWDIPPAVMEKYGKQYYLKEDQEFMTKMFPGGAGK